MHKLFSLAMLSSHSCYAFYQNYADKVRISSKLVARITRLPYMSDTRRVSYLVRFTEHVLFHHCYL